MPKPPVRLTNCCVPLVRYPSSTEPEQLLSRRDDENDVVDDNRGRGYDDDDDDNDDGDAMATNKGPKDESTWKSKNSDEQKQPQKQRGARSMRPLLLQTLGTTSTSSSTSSASSYIELGNTKILCQVQVPMIASSASHNILSLATDHGVLYCQVKYAPHMSISAGRLLGRTGSAAGDTVTGQQQQQHRYISNWKETRECNLSRSLHSALHAAVRLDSYPPHVGIGVYVTVLHDDGGVLEMAIAAASMALTRAQVPLQDLVLAARVAIVLRPQPSPQPQSPTKTDNMDMEHSDKDMDEKRFSIWVDPTEDELWSDDDSRVVVATMRLAWMPNRKMVTLWEQQQHNSSYNNAMFVIIPPAVTTRALLLCRQVCSKVLHPRIRQHIIMDQQQQQQPEQQQ